MRRLQSILSALGVCFHDVSLPPGVTRICRGGNPTLATRCWADALSQLVMVIVTNSLIIFITP